MLAATALAWAGESGPCPSVRFLGDPVALTEVEERWICGDPDSEGWRKVPLSQARYFLTAFLQDRGYHRPRFFEDQGVLSVAIGPLSRIKKAVGKGLPAEVRIAKRRRLVGEVLTPRALDDLQNWLKLGLRSVGSPGTELEFAL